MITCVSGITIRMAVKNISEQSSATQGVKLIRIDEGDSIAAITSIDEQEEEGNLELDEVTPNLNAPDTDTDAEPTATDTEAEPATEYLENFK
jgi:DNA gyrase subunit A